MYLLLVLAALGVSPFSLRALNRLFLAEPPTVGYLPSLEVRRPRVPFRSEPIEELRYGQPGWVFIGDSMLGTRIDPVRLGSISTTHDQNVGFLYHAATGPAWWYLAFKNQLAASGIRPRAVFFFFRDTNLTDTLFRLEGMYGGGPLDWVAGDREPELDAIVAARRRGVWHRVHSGVNRAYELDLAGLWLGPGIRRWYLEWRYPNQDARTAFETSLEQTFGLESLRHDVGADIGAAEAVDFARELPTSILPFIADLARQQQLTVCFVRVQRRPEAGQVPVESPALRQYVADLRAWVEARGMLFHDDTGDPEMTLDLYGDGDHVADRARYTDIFRRRMDALFR